MPPKVISGGDNPYDIHDAKLSSSATAHESSSVTAHEISNIKTSESEELHKVMTRIYKHIDYYKGNPEVKNTFDFLKMVVDSWFPNE